MSAQLLTQASLGQAKTKQTSSVYFTSLAVQCYEKKLEQLWTARQGPANVVMTIDEHKLVRKYVNRIRQKQDPSVLREELFLLPGDKPVKNSTILMQRLGQLST